MSDLPKYIKVDLKRRQGEVQATVAVDRCTGPYVSLRLNDGNPDGVNHFLYDVYGTKSVLLVSEEAREIGQKLLDFADHVDECPDMRGKLKKSNDN